MEGVRLLGSSSSALALALLLACRSSDEDLEPFADADQPPAESSPEGVPYPTDHIGSRDRAGSQRGDRLANFSFQGYVDGDRARGLRTVSMADYFDPGAARHKVLFIQISATWCTICAGLSESVVRSKQTLDTEGVAVVEVVVNGNQPQEGPSLGEVDRWMARHASNQTTVIDVAARRMRGLGVSDVPWTILVDTRSMEILDSSAGAPLDVVTYARDGLDWVARRPPSY